MRITERYYLYFNCEKKFKYQYQQNEQSPLS
jgi:hypothetical protein